MYVHISFSWSQTQGEKIYLTVIINHNCSGTSRILHSAQLFGLDAGLTSLTPSPPVLPPGIALHENCLSFKFQDKLCGAEMGRSQSLEINFSWGVQRTYENFLITSDFSAPTIFTFTLKFTARVGAMPWALRVVGALAPRKKKASARPWILAEWFSELQSS